MNYGNETRDETKVPAIMQAGFGRSQNKNTKHLDF